MRSFALIVIIVVLFISACNSALTTPTPSPAPAALATLTATVVPLPSPSLTPTRIVTTPPQTATPMVSSAILTVELKNTVEAYISPTPTPDASGYSRGDLEIKVLPLEVSDDSQPLWAVYSEGGLNITTNRHFVAIYTYRNTDWQKMNWLELEAPFRVESVNQVQLEPSQIWIEVRGKAGMRPDSYDLLRFDGELLHNETQHLINGMGHGQVVDINGDEQSEVILDQNLGYGIVCGMCLIDELEFQVLHWNGSSLEKVELTPLSFSSKARLRDLNNRAVELAQAGLWKEAQIKINQARELDPDEPTVAWNAGLINLYADSRAEHTPHPSVYYPLLAYVFYGDYEAVLDLMRPYPPEDIFNPQTPLVIGTIVEYGEKIWVRYINESVALAIQAKPELAAAYFLRGWANYLVDPDDPQVLEDVKQAAELDPEEKLFSESLIHLQGKD